MRVVDEDALYRIMVPQPLPLSWGRTVQPYDPSISLLSRVRPMESNVCYSLATGSRQIALLSSRQMLELISMRAL